MPGADVVNTKNRVLQMESQIATLSSTDTRDADEVLKSIILEWKTIKPLLETTLKRSADYRDLLEAAVFTSNLHIEAGNVLLTLITANRWLMGDEVYTAANSVYSSIERWVLGKGETNDRMQEIVGRMKSLSDVLGMKMHQSELESLPN